MPISTSTQSRRVSSAAWLLAGLALTQPASAAELTLSNMAMSIGTARLRLPTVTFAGDRLDPQAIAALRLGRAPDHFSAGLARLTADKIMLPEISFEILVGATGHTVTCRAVTLVRLDKGIAAEATSDGCAWSSISADASRTVRRGTSGPLHAKGLDLAGFVTSAAAALRPLPAESIALNEVLLATPTGQSVTATRIILSREPGSDKTVVEAGELRFQSVPNANLKSGPLTATATSGHAEIGTTIAIQLTALALAANSSRMTIGALATESGDAAPLVALAQGNENAGAALGHWLTRLDALSVSAVEADLSGAASRSQWSLERFDARRLKMDAHPSGLDATLQGLVIPTATLPDASGRLRDLGYQTLTLDGHAKTRWTASSRTLDIEDITIKASEIAAFSLAGRLDNVTAALFGPSGASAADALKAARLNTLSLTVTDLGLADRISAVGASERGTNSETVRGEFAAALGINLRARLGTSLAAATIADAVSRFVKAPGELKLTIAARDAKPGSAQPALAGSAVGLFLERMDVTALVK